MKTTIKSPITKKKTLNLGFVGLGWIGLDRMEKILQHPDVNGAAIIEPQSENATRALKIAEQAKIYDNYEKLLSNKHIDGIVIATPSTLHAEQAVQALNAKKAVFCQKPLGRNAKEVEKVVEAAQKNNQKLSVDLSYRFTEAFKRVYKVIKNGEIGTVFSAELTFHNAYGPDKEWFYDLKKSGGGCVLDLGLHLVDLALWSLDFPQIKTLQSDLFHKGDKIKNGQKIIEDFASVKLRTEHSTTINLHCSWNVSAGKDADISAKFYGTQGGVAFKNIDGSFYDFKAEKYLGTKTETLCTPPDNWGGKAGIVWAKELLNNNEFNQKDGKEFIQLAKILDKIYGR